MKYEVWVKNSPKYLDNYQVYFNKANSPSEWGYGFIIYTMEIIDTDRGEQ